MKRLHLFIVLLLPLCLLAQKVEIRHKYFTSIFDESKHIPFVVYYDLTGDMLACGDDRVERTNKFKPDPELPEATSLNKDYTSSGYDRGHNMSAEDNRCNAEGMEECFYFSNMFPQTPRLNRGIWKRLEAKERNEATEYGHIKVYIGSYGEQATIGPHEVVVPEYCWKVIWVNGMYEAYTFPNTTTIDGAISDYSTTVDYIEHQTGFHFSDN